MAGVRIGELLVQQGLLTPGQLQQALAAQQIFGGRLPLILNHRVFGVFALADLTGRDLASDVALLTELLKRVSHRLQVFYLVEQITAPM